MRVSERERRGEDKQLDLPAARYIHIHTHTHTHPHTSNCCSRASAAHLTPQKALDTNYLTFLPASPPARLHLRADTSMVVHLIWSINNQS